MRDKPGRIQRLTAAHAGFRSVYHRVVDRPGHLPAMARGPGLSPRFLGRACRRVARRVCLRRCGEALWLACFAMLAAPSSSASGSTALSAFTEASEPPSREATVPRWVTARWPRTGLRVRFEPFPQFTRLHIGSLTLRPALLLFGNSRPVSPQRRFLMPPGRTDNSPDGTSTR